jgi:hypothetical protein
MVSRRELQSLELGSLACALLELFSSISVYLTRLKVNRYKIHYACSRVHIHWSS